MKRLLFAAAATLAPVQPLAADPGPAQHCAEAGNDDTIRAYDPSLKPGLLRAYAHLFPRARMPPGDLLLQTSTHIRCMDGKLLACFTGANLPCSKMNTERENLGATAFCHANPEATVVPAFATGHDSAYTYRCSAGAAEIVGTAFQLDPQGFAAMLWAPID